MQWDTTHLAHILPRQKQRGQRLRQCIGYVRKRRPVVQRGITATVASARSSCAHFRQWTGATEG